MLFLIICLSHQHQTAPSSGLGAADCIIYSGIPAFGKTSLSVGLATNPPILYTFTKPKVETDLAAGTVLLAVPQ